jgi:hypothetical protein
MPTPPDDADTELFLLDPQAVVACLLGGSNQARVALFDAIDAGRVSLCCTARDELRDTYPIAYSEVIDHGVEIIQHQESDYDEAARLDEVYATQHNLSNAEAELKYFMIAKAKRLNRTIVTGELNLVGVSFADYSKLEGFSCKNSKQVFGA